MYQIFLINSSMNKVDIKNIVLSKNNTILDKFSLYKSKNSKLMYHITSQENAINILNNGFDISLSKRGAFGIGINLTTNINHLKHYYNNKNNYIVVCIVKFNKKQKNSSGPDIIRENGEEYTKPKYVKPSKGYDILYVPGPEIYVAPKTEQVYPILIGKIKF